MHNSRLTRPSQYGITVSVIARALKVRVGIDEHGVK